MEDAFEYELLNIEWELNYEFDLESPGRMVRDTTGDKGEESKPFSWNNQADCWREKSYT